MTAATTDLTATVIPYSTILIGNFSMDIEEWVTVTGVDYFAVDVVDLTHTITSGTYFLHDNITVSTTLSGISSGYRAYYYPTTTISGPTVITIHVENDNYEVQELDFDLLYGYHVVFSQPGTDWGPMTEVVTVAKATNEAFCANTTGAAFYFETADLPSWDLGASIRAIPSVDLGAVIYPQNSFFFYERTYIVKVSGVKDFSGNEMEEFSFTFTIEDKP